MGMEDLDRAYGIDVMPAPAMAPSKNKFQALDAAYGILSPQEDQEIRPEELTILDKSAQIPRGLATSTGGMADLIAAGAVPFTGKSPGESLALMMSGKSPEEIQATRAQHNPDINLSQDLAKYYDKLYGKDLTPTDTAGEIRQGIGAFLNPIGAKYGSVAKGAQALGKSGLTAMGKHFLKKELPMAAGASSALYGTEHLTDEGTVARGAEDLTKAIAGSIIGGNAVKSTKALGNISEKVVDAIAHPIKTSSKGVSKLMSVASKPNQEVFNVAKKYDIPLPHHIGMKSKTLSGIENNYLGKSMFTSQKHSDVYKKSAEKILGELNKTLDTVSKKSTKPSEASLNYQNVLRKERGIAKKEAKNLYEDARKHLTDKDKIVPKNAGESIKELSKEMDRDLQAPETSYVAKELAKLGKNWGIVPQKLSGKFSSDKFDNSDLRRLLSAFSGASKEIPTQRLVGVEQELSKILRRREDVPGTKNLLYGLRDSIVKDIESSTNKEFVSAYKKAKENYSENVAKRFHTRTPLSILKRDMPVEAFSKMNTVQGINRLEKSIGKSNKGLKAFNELKRAKLEDMFDKATVGGIDSKSISNANFTNIFSKNKKKQEVLERLMGKEQYKKLEEISKITNAYTEAGKDIINTSGTAPIAAEWSKLDKAASAATLVMLGQAPVTALVGAGSYIAAPYFLSRLVSNPNIVNQMRTYARARQLGNKKYADTLGVRLIKMIEKEQRSILSTAQRSKEGEQNE